MKLATPNVKLLAIDPILTHEKTNPLRIKEVAQAAARDDAFDYPIIVGRIGAGQSAISILLDGHHRLAAAIGYLGLVRVPALVVDYLDDTRVCVTAWRDDEVITKTDVVMAALAKRPMPIKTSRHSFDFDVSPCDVPLSLLRQAQRSQGEAAYMSSNGKGCF